MKAKQKRGVARVALERLNVYVAPGDDEGRAAIAWARKRWRTWHCEDHDMPRSASGLLRDVLVHAMQAERGMPRRRRID